MYARAIQLVIGAGTAQDVLDRIYADLLPSYEAAPGFRSYYVIETGTDTFVTMRAFETEADLDAATAATSDASDQIQADFDLSFSAVAQGDVRLFAQL